MANEIIQMVNPSNGNNQYPQTVLSAISDDAGNNLQTLIEHAPIARVGVAYDGNASRDADKLGGYPASDYAKNSDLTAIKPTLLWSNNAESFSAQTVQIDLSQYRFIDVYFGFVTGALESGNTLYCNRIIVGTNSVLNVTSFNTSASSVLNALNGCYRTISTTSSSITFGVGYMTYNGNIYQWNNRCVPSRIYGIK